MGAVQWPLIRLDPPFCPRYIQHKPAEFAQGGRCSGYAEAIQQVNFINIIWNVNNSHWFLIRHNLHDLKVTAIHSLCIASTSHLMQYLHWFESLTGVAAESFELECVSGRLCIWGSSWIPNSIPAAILEATWVVLEASWAFFGASWGGLVHLVSVCERSWI